MPPAVSGRVPAAKALVDFDVPANHNPATVRLLNFPEKNVGGIRYSASESAEIRSMVDNQRPGRAFLATSASSRVEVWSFFLWPCASGVTALKVAML